MKKITTRPFLASLSILTLLATGAHAGPALYKGFPRGDALITVQELRQRIDAHDPKLVILAAQNDRACRAGRIPGSRHSEWVLFKTKENPAEWLTAAEMQPVLRKLGADPKKDQYFYCQSGVRSTQGLFAMHLSGWPLEKLHNYDDSWIGWSKDTSLPLEAGLPAGDTPKHARKYPFG